MSAVRDKRYNIQTSTKVNREILDDVDEYIEERFRGTGVTLNRSEAIRELLTAALEEERPRLLALVLAVAARART